MTTIFLIPAHELELFPEPAPAPVTRSCSWFLSLLLLSLVACAPQRPPIPVGSVPEQGTVLATDEQYGHQVFGMLAERYPLDQAPENSARVERIVERLSVAVPGSKDPWHVYVLRDDGVRNAAATRGNYIFVWTGMLREIQNDDELAAIIAHEMGHVLAGHTQPTPQEEVSKMVSGVAGVVARQVLLRQGSFGVVSDLAELLAKELFNAVLINPEAQRKELEADQIGIFVVADAGYDPEHAVQFWERVKTDPEFSGFPVQFLSTHPSSEERLTLLRAHLDQARSRYLAATPSTAHAPHTGDIEPDSFAIGTTSP